MTSANRSRAIGAMFKRALIQGVLADQERLRELGVPVDDETSADPEPREVAVAVGRKWWAPYAIASEHAIIEDDEDEPAEDYARMPYRR